MLCPTVQLPQNGRWRRAVGLLISMGAWPPAFRHHGLSLKRCLVLYSRGFLLVSRVLGKHVLHGEEAGSH